MSTDYLLLKDPKQCPVCGHRSQSNKNGFCGQCGTRLFSTVGDFGQMEANGLLPGYWAFTKPDGWKHRDHFIIPGAHPQCRTLNIPKLSKDYGKKTTPDAIAARGGKLTKAQRDDLLHVRD
jgi:hypothetical protein